MQLQQLATWSVAPDDLSIPTSEKVTKFQMSFQLLHLHSKKAETNVQILSSILSRPFLFKKAFGSYSSEASIVSTLYMNMKYKWCL